MVNDTIAAIATPIGEGGIGIVRISGKDALKIAEKIFCRKKGKISLGNATYRMFYGYIIDPENGEKIDEVIISVMLAPHSYTCEDVVEINCHGGVVPLQRTLELVLRMGARLAEPGEFTKRAFLNGRIDLSQAEAVIDIIRAKTDISRRVALQQMEGRLSRLINSWRERLLNVIAHIEASIDFPEDVGEVNREEIVSRLQEIVKGLDELLQQGPIGKIYREGINTVIVGRPNVGKSSLLNYFAGEEKAIVTAVPGTTRDIIEEYINIKGIPLRLVDTAGIRETVDIVEEIGVRKAREAMLQADLILFVLDASTGILREEEEWIKELKDRPMIIIINKIDLANGEATKKRILEQFGNLSVVAVSVAKGTGMDQLEEEIYRLITGGKVRGGESAFLTRTRHIEAVRKAKEALQAALIAVVGEASLDVLAVDVRSAFDFLGEITGATVQEDIIDKIFAEFCIGK